MAYSSLNSKYRFKNFDEIKNRFHISNERAEKLKYYLFKEGYSEQGICYAISRAEEKLLRFIGDNRFDNIFQNEVKKYAYKKNDVRWNKKGRSK